MPRCFLARSTDAKTRKWSARSARLIHSLAPLSTYESPSRRAVVASAAASVPAPGSVRPNVASFSPRACGTSQRCFCSSVRPLHQRQRVEPDMDAHDHAEGGVGALQLLAQDAEADVVHASAAPALPDGRAQEPQLAHLLEDVAADLALRVPLADVRLDLGRGEVAHRLLHELVLVRQREVDRHLANRNRHGLDEVVAKAAGRPRRFRWLGVPGRVGRPANELMLTGLSLPVEGPRSPRIGTDFRLEQCIVPARCRRPPPPG